MNLLEEVARHLEFEGLGRTGEKCDLFYGVMPPEPDICLSVLALDLGAPGREGRIQILLRDLNPRALMERSEELVRRLDGFEGYLGGCLSLASLSLLSGPRGMGSDERRRCLCAVHFRILRCGI